MAAIASIMAWVVIASPDSASTLAAASRALVFLALGSFAAFLFLVLAGAAGSGGLDRAPGWSCRNLGAKS